MLRNYLITTLRHLRKHKGYVLINTAGLGVGIAACLLIALYVQDELSYDRFHEQADHLYRIVETRRTPEGSKRAAGTAGPVGPSLVREAPGVKAAVRLTRLWRLTVEHGDARFYEGDYLLTEPSFFDLFGFPLAQGDPSTQLREPHTVVLTHEAARRYFGDANPVGQTLQVEALGETTVTGVLAPLPETSHLQFSMLFPFATTSKDTGFWDDWIGDWAPSYRTLTTYVRLDDRAAPAAVEAQLAGLVQNNTPPEAQPQALTLQPVTDIHLRSEGIEGGFNAQLGTPTYLYVFSIIALLIILIAGINYINLATAQGAERAREVGVRKAVGAVQTQLVIQFLGEAVLLTVMACAVGLLLAWAALPAFNALAGKTLALGSILSPALLGSLLLGALALGVLAGSYPAFYLARFDPTRSLKEGAASAGGGATWLRRSLVVTQFALSIVLIVATLVVARQLEYVQTKRLGFDKEHLVVVDINSSNVRSNVETMKAEMLRYPAIQQVSVSSRIPGDWKELTEIQTLPPGATEEEVQSAYFLGVDEAFLATYQIALQAGRNFEATRGTDTTAVLLNEAAVQALGLREPVGQTIRVPGMSLEGGGRTDTAVGFHVIGVVADFHFQSLHEPIRPLVLGYHHNPIANIDYFTARVQAGHMTATLDHLRAIGERFDPSHPFEYNFLDQRIAEVYATDERVGYLFGIAAGLAILIACFGLFGLAAFTVQRRTKEIGIRKVLGATVTSIVALISKDFATLVLAAFVVAAPVAYVVMQQWLQSFAYRIDIGLWVLAAAGALALLIALLTVSYQAIKAALADPVESLRYE